jgi:hypothetical protein
MKALLAVSLIALSSSLSSFAGDTLVKDLLAKKKWYRDAPTVTFKEKLDLPMNDTNYGFSLQNLIGKKFGGDCDLVVYQKTPHAIAKGDAYSVNHIDIYKQTLSIELFTPFHLPTTLYVVCYDVHSKEITTSELSGNFDHLFEFSK